ncbi:choline dehydrogenase [Marinomonas sp. CT5]|uniref:GMC family oxidoreductase n=1 Tax=Marinomonas sp. CT5 TaxID=2066133 RepID=UPI001BB0B9D4|nr:choline dehydrogenase [Marinomonas sp. CT5]QUX97166.1 choline dehydrogenase [Marinomonas sp. CT5]
MLDKVTFDYIVIGAGTSGCVVASRLSENPNNKVLLIEAGGKDSSFWLKIPVGYGKTIADPKVNWCYETEENPSLNGRRIFWPRGKVLGGSGSINGLMYIRGQAEDYDGWRDLGNKGWSYKDVLPYFKKSEDQENGEDTWHGVGGPVTVTNLADNNPLYDALIGSAQAVGIKRNEDFNGLEQSGAGYYQGTIKNGMRVSAATAYLKPALQRENLTITTRSQVEKLIINNGQVDGVRFFKNSQYMTVYANKEVILSGGTINSPHLLMLSGIGDEDELKKIGVGVKVNLPGVGKNLQDHYGGQITWKCNQPITLNDVMMSKWRQMKEGLKWLALRKGPLAVPAGQAGLFTQILEESKRPDIQFLFQSFSGGYYEDGLYKFSGFANFMCPIRPKSRGEIKLKSSNPKDTPLLMPNYFSHEYDRSVLLGGFKLAREIANKSPLKKFILSEHLPGKDINTDDEILDYFRMNGGCVSHQVGTCKMGSDKMAVVDSKLRVYGIRKLRVADASIMPTEISGNTNAACLMIGEKAADFIMNKSAN